MVPPFLARPVRWPKLGTSIGPNGSDVIFMPPGRTEKHPFAARAAIDATARQRRSDATELHVSCRPVPRRVLQVSSSYSQPDLSIAIPHVGDEGSFETSLISVLENRPERCEVLVAHDGSYSDPFDLGDEVRFVVAEQGDVVSLVLAAAQATRCGLLHVLAGGARATEGWTEAAVEAFDDPATAAVAPRAMQDNGSERIATIGWTDRIGGLCRGVATGRRKATRRDLVSVRGPLLEASFWRTDWLCQLAVLPTDADPVVAQCGWSQALMARGHRIVAANDSCVQIGPEPSGLGPLPARTACRLQAIQQVIQQRGGGAAVAAGLVSILAGVHRPSIWREAIGRMAQPLCGGDFARRYAAGLRTFSGSQDAATDRLDPPHTLSMPRRSATAAGRRSYGRAA